MAGKICIFLTSLGANDSPPVEVGAVVFETLIDPAMFSFPDFELGRVYVYENETGSITRDLLVDIEKADLVIADITGMDTSGFFLVGARHATGLPLVLIQEQHWVFPAAVRDFNICRYSLDAKGRSETSPTEVATLVSAITDALEYKTKHGAAGSSIDRLPPARARKELATRIVEATESIRLLRINSASDAIAELEIIAEELERVPDDQTPSALRETAEKFLKILARFADQLSTVRGSRMLISGIVSLVVGGAGFNAVAAYGMSLAFWEGKETFLKATEMLFKKKS